MISELKRVAEYYGFRRFSGWEFNEASNLCKRSTIIKEFGSWDKALSATQLELKPYKNKRSDIIPEDELFQELERVWRLLGHRPSRTEWESVKPKYSYSVYKSRFDGWVNACAAFIDFKSDTNVAAYDSAKFPQSKIATKTSREIRDEEKRAIPLRLRLDVLKRDHFRCTFCGRSPAIETGVILHIDHKKPFSRGGLTTLENLQCLCMDCNFGKGDINL